MHICLLISHKTIEWHELAYNFRILINLLHVQVFHMSVLQKLRKPYRAKVGQKLLTHPVYCKFQLVDIVYFTFFKFLLK